MDNELQEKSLIIESESEKTKMDRFKTIFILFFGLIIVFGFLYSLYQIFVPIGGEKEKIFTVKKGDGLNIVAENLKGGGFIRNKIFFIIYVFDKGS